MDVWRRGAEEGCGFRVMTGPNALAWPSAAPLTCLLRSLHLGVLSYP